MSSGQIQLLRRPLPPKNTPARCRLVECSLSQDDEKREETSEHSSHGDTPTSNYCPPSTPLAFSRPETPLTPHKIINSFPSRPLRIFPKAPILGLLEDNPRYAPLPPIFCLDDFIKSGKSESGTVQPGKSESSRCKHKKFIDHSMLELHSGHQREVANLILSCEVLPPVESRTPQRQILCELAALTYMRARAEYLRHLEDNRILWTPDEKLTVHAHTSHDENQVVLSSITDKHFQGLRRSRSPFLTSVSPTEHAVLECIKYGGSFLNLKAHFISQLPDLSLLVSSLLYLNLSFNDFIEFPLEVCKLSKLEVLKLRDNPIEEIPVEIEKLINLKTLVVSFCKLTALPCQLYNLPSLQHLDVSHNLIGHVSKKIRNLRSLLYLNLEGNQLTGLPISLQSLSVSQLKLDGNWLSTQNTPHHTQTGIKIHHVCL
ncbi:leucine-rich repeat-containing protein 63 isoform X2 [Trichomycterus rosablanca]|uniref:leucine-rich repeat-containing protein 63 isoform X2 n=1 Tax=Trichomycterus rosablanca TaxID=2290929 RepID=UPI002F35B7F7